MDKELLIKLYHQTRIGIFTAILICIWAIISSNAQQPSSSNGPSSKFDKKIAEFHAKNEEFTDLLVRISRLYQIPLGIEKIGTDSASDHHRKFTFSMYNIEIGDLLDRICTLDNRYKWTAGEGLVVIQPALEHKNNLTEGFLSIRIKDLSFSPNDTFYGVRTKFAAVPEVVSYLKANNTRSDLEFLGSILTKPGLKSVVTFQDRTVLEILNELALRTGRCWIVSRTNDGLFLSIE